jgi:tyrosinase-like protein
MQQRKDINALTPAEIDTYVHALNILRRRSQEDPEDKTGYDYQARLHNDLEVGPCEHGNDQFFAWHRCHLYYFEKLLRESDPPRTGNIAIPYWDWARLDPGGGRYPAAFSLPGLTAPRFAEGASLGSDTIQVVRNERQWNEFGGWPKLTPGHDYGSFEWGPHNYMHPRYIGGLMGQAETAAEDPMYWSFHCFIDLLWAEWQRRNPNEAATSPEARLRGFTGQPLSRVAEFQSTIALDCEYLLNAALRREFAEPSPPAPLGELLTADKARAQFQGTLQDQLLLAKTAEWSLPRLAAPARQIRLVLNDLTVPNIASFTLYVYVHPRARSFDTQSEADRESFYAGRVTMWKAHAHDAGHDGGHGHHGAAREPHHPTSANARLDVTALITRLRSLGHEDLVTTFKFVPAPLPFGGPAPVPQLIREIELRDLTFEVSR